MTPPGSQPGLGPSEGLALAEVASLLLWRVPLACFLVAEVALVVYGVGGYPSTLANYAGLVATGIAAWGCGGLVRYATLGGAVLGTLVVGLGQPGGAPWVEILANLLLVVGAWSAGWGVRGQQDAHEARLAVAAEAQAVRLAEERLAIATMPHDHAGNAIAAATRQLESAAVLDAEEGASVTRRANARLRATLGDIAELVGGWSTDPSGPSGGDGPPASPQAAEPAPEGEEVFRRLQRWVVLLSGAGVAVSRPESTAGWRSTPSTTGCSPTPSTRRSRTS